MTRRLYIDWLRGLAVLVMILWHSIDAWTLQTGRDTTAFWVIAFAAGWVAPSFLFLAGVSLPLAAQARMRRGSDRAHASASLVRRGWEVFLIAHAFRFQSFLFNPNGTWNGLLKPDILNILGLGMVAVAVCWKRASSPADSRRWLLLPAVAVALLTPFSRLWWWPTLLHPRLEAYIRPVGNYGVFSLLPSVAFMFAGAYVGALIANASSESEATLHGRMATVGTFLVVIGTAVNQMPWPSIAYWTDTPAVCLWRVGAMTCALAGAWALFRRRSPSHWNPLLVFGQTSLFVYWVHVELTYGAFSYPLRHALTLPWSLTAYALLTVLMFGLAVLWARRPRGPLIPVHMAIAR